MVYFYKALTLHDFYHKRSNAIFLICQYSYNINELAIQVKASNDLFFLQDILGANLNLSFINFGDGSCL